MITRSVLVLSCLLATACAEPDFGDDLEIVDDADAGRAPSRRMDQPPRGPTSSSVDGGVPADAGPADAGPCTLPTKQVFPALSPWTLRGSAIDVTPSVRLTADSQSQLGGLYYENVLKFDHFDVSFTYEISNKSPLPGDGLAFAWIEGTAIPSFGRNGDGLGVAGHTGYAVVLDSYYNSENGDPAVPYLGLRATKDMAKLASTPVRPNLGNGVHDVRVLLKDATVTVWVDGALAFPPRLLPFYQPFSGHFAFTAATSRAQSAHSISNVTMRVGTTGPCAPTP